MTDKTYLEQVYRIEGPETARQLYDAWAESYDTELKGAGYATPRRVAEALAAYLPDKAAPVLDFACGTGMSGEALAAAGFTTIDGVDISEDSLKVARRKGVYRHLWPVAPGQPLPVTPGDHAAVTAAGAIGHGAAPVEAVDLAMNALGPGGLFVVSFNDRTLEEPVYEARLSEYTDTGAARLLFREHGDHLPAIGLKAVVYVLEKA